MDKYYDQPRFFNEMNIFASVPQNICFNLLHEDGTDIFDDKIIWELYVYGESKPIMQVKTRSENGQVIIKLSSHNTKFFSGKYIQVIEGVAGKINIYSNLDFT